MSNEKNVIPDEAKEILDSVVKNFGFKVIKTYMELHRKEEWKKRKRVNTKEEVAYDVYKIMFNEKCSRKNAIHIVGDKRKIKEKTINNHLNNFNREAKNNNFYTFGWFINEMYELSEGSDKFTFRGIGLEYSVSECIKLLAKENELDKKVLETYYYRYKTLPKREKSKYKVDINSITIPNNLLFIIPQKYIDRS
jgi:hypothetical protein